MSLKIKWYMNMIDSNHPICYFCRDIPEIGKLEVTNLLRVSCLFCIFKHSPPKNGLTAKTGII
ncbi:hypothetical protein D7V78_11985 [Parabacteroides distasonis]|uniref:Uncharacterized protein n=1 Tax=Parabacteroides distasonis TaxID=823 RepID=A0A3L7ZSZ2_PARDI|nr:hypothetical protein D7V78_11985 [Parabacteroides distasonis]